VFDYPIPHYDIEVSHINTMEKKLKRRQGLKAKQEEREDKEFKSTEEDQEKRSQVKTMKVTDLMT
jgi:hypothetical protein